MSTVSLLCLLKETLFLLRIGLSEEELCLLRLVQNPLDWGPEGGLGIDVMRIFFLAPVEIPSLEVLAPSRDCGSSLGLWTQETVSSSRSQLTLSLPMTGNVISA